MIYKIYNESSKTNTMSEEDKFYSSLMEFSESMHQISTSVLIEGYECRLFLEENWLNESTAINEGVGEFLGNIIKKIKAAISKAIQFIKDKITAIKNSIFKKKIDKADPKKIEEQKSITIYEFDIKAAQSTFDNLIKSDPTSKFTNSDQEKNFIDYERSRSNFTPVEDSKAGTSNVGGYVKSKTIQPTKNGIKAEWEKLSAEYTKFMNTIQVLGDKIGGELDEKVQDALSSGNNSNEIGNVTLFVSALTDLVSIYTQNVSKVIEHNRKALERCVDAASGNTGKQEEKK